MAVLKILSPKIFLITGLILLITLLWLVKTNISPTPSSKIPAQSLLPSASLTEPSIEPSPTETGQRGDPSFWQEINQKLDIRYPLFPYLPYKTQDFEINYIGPLKLEVLLKTATESAKTEALKWLESYGVNKDNHEIIFK